jgi:hypothetical protein
MLDLIELCMSAKMVKTKLALAFGKVSLILSHDSAMSQTHLISKFYHCL